MYVGMWEEDGMYWRTLGVYSSVDKAWEMLHEYFDLDNVYLFEFDLNGYADRCCPKKKLKELYNETMARRP